MRNLQGQKGQKGNILALCFSLKARVESRVEIARGIVRRKQARGFNKSFPCSVKIIDKTLNKLIISL